MDETTPSSTKCWSTCSEGPPEAMPWPSTVDRHRARPLARPERVL